MRPDPRVPWADCIRVLRRAGFVCAAESPAAVVLVRAGRSVLLQRMPALDEPELVAAIRGAGLSGEAFLGLLDDGRGRRSLDDGPSG
jgi:hypothetical protein